ncbi:MAG: hypothetical protein ACI81P_001601 [Neolewinella sp.]|jgi:hypothetical protein
MRQRIFNEKLVNLVVWGGFGVVFVALGAVAGAGEAIQGARKVA